MVSKQSARVVLALLVVAASASGLAQSAASPQETVTREQFDRWFEQVKNWGRWGTNGAIGTLNLISSAKRQRAAVSVRSGTVVSLAHEFETGPSLNNPSPLKLTVRSEAESTGSDVAWASESLSIEAFHGFANSHMDWLSHTLYRGVLFDGVTSADVRPEGVNLRGVHTLTNGIVTRGVLIDAAELKEVSDLAPGVTITTSDLEAWERKTGVKVEAGDVVLVRTGRWAREGRLGPWKIEGGSAPGLHPSVALWLHARGVAALGSDVVNDVIPSPVQGMLYPLHQLALVAMGMPLFDNLDLEAAVREARTQGRWTFLLSVAPLRVKGGTGSPVNPLAIF